MSKVSAPVSPSWQPRQYSEYTAGPPLLFITSESMLMVLFGMESDT
ncbi:MAG: hypothetical protein M0018_01635 [Nitrospiraceae bacterium]|nr:hypothetical protein [Nitrospiraceae bacterium]